MEWLSRPTKRLLLEMSVGVILYTLILAVLAWVFMPKFSYPAGPVLRGLLVGAAGAILMLIHIAVMTERVLSSQNEGYANKTTLVSSLIRRVVFIAALFFCWRWFRINLLAAVIGAMGMKAGAYLQPLVHKISSRGAEQEAPASDETDAEIL